MSIIARPRQSAKSRKPSAPLPMWFDAVAKFLRDLGLSPSELLAVTTHLGSTGAAVNVPVLNRTDCRRLAMVMCDATNGHGAWPAPAPVEPDASTDLTPEPLGAYHASPEDWESYSSWSHELDVAIVEPQVETVSSSIPSVRTSTDRPAWAMSAQTARWLAFGMCGHFS